MKRSRPSWGLYQVLQVDTEGRGNGVKLQNLENWAWKLAHAREDGSWTPGPETSAAPTEARMAVDE